jgi:Fe-S-cluster containining protein
MTIPFSCTACGRCCHDLRLPLSVREAIDWIARGGTVELLCDAAPANDDAADPASAYRRERSLAGVSGTLAIRVNVTLAATFTGACPHLLPSMWCGAYEARPNTCRIYPAELLPGRVVDPPSKLCPPEAWDGRGLPLDQQAHAVAEARAAALADVPHKQRLVALLGLDIAALSNEGLMIHRPDLVVLADALAASSDAADEVEPHHWRFATRSAATAALIADAGGVTTNADAGDRREYLSLTGVGP